MSSDRLTDGISELFHCEEQFWKAIYWFNIFRVVFYILLTLHLFIFISWRIVNLPCLKLSSFVVRCICFICNYVYQYNVSNNFLKPKVKQIPGITISRIPLNQTEISQSIFGTNRSTDSYMIPVSTERYPWTVWNIKIKFFTDRTNKNSANINIHFP